LRKSSLQLYLFGFILLALARFVLWALQYTSYWYASFFLEAQRNGIHSYRITSILSDRDCRDASLLWEVESLAKASISQLSAFRVDVKIELWIQDEVSSDSLQKLQRIFSPYPCIHVQPLSKIIPSLQSQSLPSWVSGSLDPSSQSFLKLWALTSHYDLNLYIDPSLWSEYADRSHIPIAAYAYGVKGIEKAKRSFFMRRTLPGLDKTSLDYAHACSDFLMAKKNSWDLLAIQKRALLRDQLYGDAFRRFEEEDRWLALEGNQSKNFVQAQTLLKERLKWFKDNPDLPMQTTTLGNYLFGTVFLEKSINNSIEKNYKNN